MILTWLSGRVEPDTRQFGMFDYPSELQMTPVINDYGMMMGMSVDPDAEAYFAREIPAATDRFAALAPEAQRAWLESNWDALRTGDLILEDLP